MLPCPLCENSRTASRLTAGQREFWQCDECALTFVPPQFHLEGAEEKARYDTHENYPDDPAYRNFFRPFFDALTKELPPGAKGIDFGAGPGPALAEMLRERGFSVALYDKFFHPQKDVLGENYDFVACTETAEHFQRPRAEFELFQRLLRPGGCLGILTGMLAEGKKFDDWYYHRDPTHVAFYEKRTMEWIGKRFSWESSFPAPNVTLFRKPL